MKRIRPMISIILVVAMSFTLTGLYTLEANGLVTSEGTTLSKTISSDRLIIYEDTGDVDSLSIDYKIQFDSIEATTAPGEVVIIIDTSVSMDEMYNGTSETRLEVVQRLVNEFIDKMSLDDESAIAIVTFDGIAKVYKDGFVNVSENVDDLKAYVSGLSTYRGSNLGDAMRRSYHLVNKGDASKNQFIIAMTDGGPDGFSIESAKTRTSIKAATIGTYYENYGDPGTLITKIYDYSFYVDDGQVDEYYLNIDESMDYDLSGIRYARDLASMMDGMDIRFISLDENIESYKIHTLASHAGVVSGGNDAYYPSELEALFDGYEDEVDTAVITRQVYFEEVLPDGVTVSSMDSALVLNGNVLSGTYTIIFERSEDGTTYEAEPLTFNVVITPDKDGEFTLGANDTSGIHYEDTDGVMVDEYFEEVTFSAVLSSNLIDYEPTIELSDSKVIVVNKASKTSGVVHVKVNGVDSEIVEVFVKKLPEGDLEGEENHFIGSNAATNDALGEYDSGNGIVELQATPFSIEVDIPDTWQDYGYLTYTESGYYAVYVVTDDGNVVIETIRVIFVSFNDMI